MPNSILNPSNISSSNIKGYSSATLQKQRKSFLIDTLLEQRQKRLEAASTTAKMPEVKLQKLFFWKNFFSIKLNLNLILQKIYCSSVNNNESNMKNKQLKPLNFVIECEADKEKCNKNSKINQENW